MQRLFCGLEFGRFARGYRSLEAFVEVGWDDSAGANLAYRQVGCLAYGSLTSLCRQCLISPCTAKRPSRARASIRLATKSYPASPSGKSPPRLPETSTIIIATFFQDASTAARIASSILESAIVTNNCRTVYFQVATILGAKTCRARPCREFVVTFSLTPALSPRRERNTPPSPVNLRTPVHRASQSEVNRSGEGKTDI